MNQHMRAESKDESMVLQESSCAIKNIQASISETLKRVKNTKDSFNKMARMNIMNVMRTL